MRILFVIPPGLPDVISHHEATSGMGALVATAPADGAFLYPPHTIAVCAAVARDAGLDVAVLEGARHATAAGFAQAVAEQPCDLLAVLVSHGTAPADASYLRLLQRVRGEPRRAPILLFGPSAHLAAGPLLAADLADAVLVGEPEGAFVEAAHRAAAGAPSGVVWAADLAPGRCGADGLLTDLDALPFPAWDLVPWQSYADVSVLSSRGCPDGCAYCAYTVAQGDHLRAQTPARTVAELAWVAQTIRPRRVQVRDPVFARDRGRVIAICEGLLAQNVTISFNCESRPEHFDDELLRLLKRAGCWRVKIGLESGDPAVLLRLGRMRDVASAEHYIADVVRVARMAATLDLKCQVFVMAGLPGQDAASLARTEAVLRRLPASTQILARPYQPHPGTPLQAAAIPVPADVLVRLARSNQPQAGGVRRVWHLLIRRGAEVRRSRGAEAQRRGGDGQKSASHNLKPLTWNLQPGIPTLAWPDTRVFLTGGNGFVGGHVARALVAAGARVTALVRPGSSLGALADLPVAVVRGDLARPADWRETLSGCRVCIHLAALYAGADRAEDMMAVNVDATAALLAACAAAGVARVVHTSTIGTAGRPADRGLPDEATPFNLWDQASGYVRSKYLGEQVARAWNGAGLEVVIVKPAAPVGAGDARPTVTGRRIIAALRGQVTPYPAGGINHAPVADIAAGHLLAAERGAPGRAYILGHREGNLDHAAFLRLVAEAAGAPMLRAPRRTVNSGSLPDALTADPARAISELGMPQGSLRAAFGEAVAWFRAHPVQEVRPRPAGPSSLETPDD
jgi:dihydroflavonol-4-reductase